MQPKADVLQQEGLLGHRRKLALGAEDGSERVTRGMGMWVGREACASWAM